MSDATTGRSEVLACYERLAMLSRRLLRHARREEWGSLPALEEECSAIVALLRHIEPSEQLDPRQLVQRESLRIRIRCDYDAVASAVQPQLRQLRDVLQTMRQEHMLRLYEH